MPCVARNCFNARTYGGVPCTQATRTVGVSAVFESSSVTVHLKRPLTASFVPLCVQVVAAETGELIVAFSPETYVHA